MKNKEPVPPEVKEHFKEDIEGDIKKLKKEKKKITKKIRTLGRVKKSLEDE